MNLLTSNSSGYNNIPQIHQYIHLLVKKEEGGEGREERLTPQVTAVYLVYLNSLPSFLGKKLINLVGIAQSKTKFPAVNFTLLLVLFLLNCAVYIIPIPISKPYKKKSVGLRFRDLNRGGEEGKRRT